MAPFFFLVILIIKWCFWYSIDFKMSSLDPLPPPPDTTASPTSKEDLTPGLRGQDPSQSLAEKITTAPATTSPPSPPSLAAAGRFHLAFSFKLSYERWIERQFEIRPNALK